MIDLVTARPLADAVSRFGARTPLGSTLSSREWEDMPLALRELSFFSSRVENERILAAMQQRILQRVALERTQIGGGQSIGMDRGRFIMEIQERLRLSGYQPERESDKGTVRDLSSVSRLGLIWDMNLAMARGYAQWKAGHNPDLVEAVPALELVRGSDRIEERPWPHIWAEAGGKFYGEPGPDYPLAPGRMIALKSDPIWIKISQFGVPWPPFRWGSGMILRGVRWRHARELQIPGYDQPQTFPDLEFARGVQASSHGLPEAGMERLRSELGDTIRVDQKAEVIRFEPATERSPEHRNESIPEQLSRRAREIADAGREQIEIARKSDEESAWPRDFFWSGEAWGLLASISAVSIGRRLLYHAPWGEFAGKVGSLLGLFLPGLVAVAIRDGHLYAWRRDLLPLALDVIHDLIIGDSADKGRLTGYGPRSGVRFSNVRFRFAGHDMGGFDTAASTAKVYAKARLRDYVDAGYPVTVSIDGKEVAL